MYILALNYSNYFSMGGKTYAAWNEIFSINFLLFQKLYIKKAY